MKLRWWIQLLVVVVEICVLLTPSSTCFTIPVSVQTGLTIIIALLKVKAIVVKVLLGLKAMGYESFVWRTHRIRRSAIVRRVRSTIEGDELVEAWNDLQNVAGKVINFNLTACLSGSTSGDKDVSSVGSNRRRRSYKVIDDGNFSFWVSKTLGVSLKEPIACHILDNKLRTQIITNAASSLS